MLVVDHPVLRVGLASVLTTSHGFAVVAEAEDGTGALALYRQHRPDVVLLDVSMERMDGIETLRRLRAEFPGARVIMLTSSKAPEDAALSLSAGALGYLVKTVHHSVIADAIRTVHAGRHVGSTVADAATPSAGPLTRGCASAPSGWGEPSGSGAGPARARRWRRSCSAATTTPTWARPRGAAPDAFRPRGSLGRPRA